MTDLIIRKLKEAPRKGLRNNVVLHLLRDRCDQSCSTSLQTH